MNINEIQNALQSLQFIHGKDCSEYAEDLQERLGGSLLDYRSQNGRQFRINPDHITYDYHTVLELDGIIIDYLNQVKQIWNKNEYETNLFELNGFNVGIVNQHQTDMFR